MYASCHKSMTRLNGAKLGTEWPLSRRDRLIVARHEVPRVGVKRLRPGGRSKSLSVPQCQQDRFNRPAGTGPFSSLFQALRAWLGVWDIYTRSCRLENLCPEGARELSPGFQPWEAPPERRALKGRQIKGTNNVPVESSSSTFQ
jgi:hypothetical protein